MAGASIRHRRRRIRQRNRRRPSRKSEGFLVIEPIFEADFTPHSFGFRPKRSAHDAIDDIANALGAGHTQVIDADLSSYFGTIPHAKLMAAVAKRIVDGAILAFDFEERYPYTSLISDFKRESYINPPSGCPADGVHLRLRGLARKPTPYIGTIRSRIQMIPRLPTRILTISTYTPISSTIAFPPQS